MCFPAGHIISVSSFDDSSVKHFDDSFLIPEDSGNVDRLLHVHKLVHRLTLRHGKAREIDKDSRLSSLRNHGEKA